MESEVEALIDWCLTSTLAIFQLYRGEKTFYYNLELKLLVDEKLILQISLKPVD
jgi:hypothetical protein